MSFLLWFAFNNWKNDKNMQETDTNNIAQLIYKKVIGQIQPEEEAWLDAWRKEDDRNEALYVQLTDVHFLEQE